MRLHLLAALALLSAAPLASALVAASCVPTCDVHAVGEDVRNLFVPALTVVQTGSTVSWIADDATAHTATDVASFCFNAGFGPVAIGSALFVIDSGQLLAAADGDELEPCTAARALPDGSFLLDYTCLYHRDMQAKIIVR